MTPSTIQTSMHTSIDPPLLSKGKPPGKLDVLIRNKQAQYRSTIGNKNFSRNVREEIKKLSSQPPNKADLRTAVFESIRNKGFNFFMVDRTGKCRKANTREQKQKFNGHFDGYFKFLKEKNYRRQVQIIALDLTNQPIMDEADAAKIMLTLSSQRL